MATVVTDTLRGTSGTFNKTGFSYDRGFHVDGLSGDKSQMLFEAATATGIPVLNSVHPNNIAMWVESINPTVTGDRSADVIVRYATRPGGEKDFEPDGDALAGMTIDFSGTLQQVTTVQDKDGKQILVPYTPNGVGTTQIEQPGEVPMLQPFSVMTFGMTFGFDPQVMADFHLGHVNSTIWRVDKAPKSAPRQWLCTNFSGRSDDNGRTWKTTITMRKNKLLPFRNWDVPAWYIDKATGRLPTDPVPKEGNGMLRVKVYPEVDFNPLGLDIRHRIIG